MFRKRRQVVLLTVAFLSVCIYFTVFNNECKTYFYAPFQGEFINDSAFRSEDPTHLINTMGCQMTYLNPFNPDFPKSLYINHTNERVNCSKCCDFNQERDNPLNIKIERFNFSYVKIEKPDHVTCVSRIVFRKDEKGDKEAVFDTKTTKIVNSLTLFEDLFLIQIECFDGNFVYKKLVQLLPKIERDVPVPDSGKEKPNVLILLTDSISRLNFERQFPKTKEFLAKNDFKTLFGYSKVADNTLLNLIPLLTGEYLRHWKNEEEEMNEYWDDLPYI